MMWKQYLRLIPAYLGWFNKGAFLYQINAILKKDIFIVSFPKSGNTWTRFIIASFFHPVSSINNRSIDELVPDVYRNKKTINALPQDRIIKTHNSYFEYHPKSIYIIRDYRDVIVSLFYYSQLSINTGMSLDDFIKSDQLKHPFGTWAEHAQKAIDWKEKHPEKIIIIKYEDLIDKNEATIEQLFQFCEGKLKLSAESIYEAFSYKKMKEDESRHGNYFTDHTQKSFYRNGKKEDWKNHLSESNLQVILSDEATKKILKYFTYI